MLQLYGRLLKQSKYFGSKITIDVFEFNENCVIVI